MYNKLYDYHCDCRYEDDSSSDLFTNIKGGSGKQDRYDPKRHSKNNNNNNNIKKGKKKKYHTDTVTFV